MNTYLGKDETVHQSRYISTGTPEFSNRNGMKLKTEKF